MPFYEYQCSQCGSITETLQAVGANEPPVCSNCQSRETRKVMSVSGAPRMAPAKRSTPPPSCSGCSRGSCGMQ